MSKELTEAEKKAQTEKQEQADRELLAKKSKVPVTEIQPTQEEEFNGKVNQLVKDLFKAVNHADYNQVETIKRVVADAFGAALKANYETDLLADYDPFTPKPA